MKRLFVLFVLTAIAGVAAAHEPAAATTVILVRHAEKELAPALADPPLTKAGQDRALELARVLAGTKVDAIFTTPFARTRSTAAPLAEAKKVVAEEIKTGTTYAADVAARIRKDFRGKTVVVVGHSNTTQQVIVALGAEGAPHIPESEYDNFFIVTVGGGIQPSLVSLRYGAATR